RELRLPGLLPGRYRSRYRPHPQIRALPVREGYYGISPSLTVGLPIRLTTRDSVEYKSNNIEEFIMAEETTDKPKSGRTFDSAYGFSFSIAVGLALFIAGLVISLTLGEGTSIGLIFGIPLLVAGLVIPVFM